MISRIIAYVFFLEVMFIRRCILLSNAQGRSPAIFVIKIVLIQTNDRQTTHGVEACHHPNSDSWVTIQAFDTASFISLMSLIILDINDMKPAIPFVCFVSLKWLMQQKLIVRQQIK